MSETFYPHCGGLHHPGTGSCPEFPLAGRTLPDGLRVLERLGEGALGELYLAEYLDSHVEVEFVILRPEARGSEPAAEAAGLVHLRDQLHRAARIEHPNVASVRAMGETEEGAPWVAFEVFRGELLSEILSERDVLPPNEGIDLVLQAASGLQAAHEVGLVHGNLSPDTMLVTRTADNRPLVKLIHFGLVQHGAEPSVGGGGREGYAWSTRYAAPERLTGHSPDERSDVFSLGAVLQHLLTGAPPSAWRRDEAPRIPEAARRVLAKALESPPDDRFQTVAAFARALTTATSRPPARIRSGGRRAGRLGGVLARMVHLIPEPTRSARRNLVPLGAAAAALVVLSAGLWLLWGTQRLTLPALTRPRAQESGAVARPEPESQSAWSSESSSSESLAPASRQADSLSASPVRRGSVNSGRPVGSARPPAASSPRPDDRAASDSMLVDVRSVDSTIQVDLRYATANNFTGAPLPGYEATRALLRREAAAALGRVQAKLRSKSLGLRLFDAYRPVRASRAMVDWAERTGHRALLESGYITQRSRHNLGVAVDLTMVDLVTGTEVPMGTTFDNFTAAQMADASGEALRYRQILAEAMESEGFSPHGGAWWHFNYPLEGAVPLDRVIR
jgi:D-alanyl-D-alanine dipeptidase